MTVSSAYHYEELVDDAPLLVSFRPEAVHITSHANFTGQER